jgi:segregation and condensation protein B
MKGPLKNIIESLIFVSVEPLTPEKIKNVLTEYSSSEIETALQELVESYTSPESGIEITRSAGGYLYSTKPEYDSWVKKLLNLDKRSRLSAAALETLSIIAYHQPVTLAEVSAIRGVDATHSLKTLLIKRLVKITGRKKSPGKPLIYRTSTKFLTYFGLNSLQDLPTTEEIEKLLEEEKNEG